MNGDVEIRGFIRAQGFDTPAAAGRAREALEAAGLTRSGKRAFATTKRAAAEAALASALVRVCSEECLRIDREGFALAREWVTVTPRSCEVCGGSNNRRAAIDAARLLRRRGVRNILIVGGSNAVRNAIRTVFHDADGLEFRMIDGTNKSHSAKDAEPNKRWADVVVIWGSSQLRHPVSKHYTRDLPDGVRMITLARRGVEALCNELVRSYT